MQDATSTGKKRRPAPAYAPGDQRVIPVLGMHRSGTSMVTRLLNLLGVELSWPIQPPSADNPLGFWEHRFFQTVNIQILEGLGGHQDGWGTAADLAHIGERASQFQLEDGPMEQVGIRLSQFFNNSIWGWKDPRCMLTWGFWQRALQSYGYTDLRPVIVIRNPIACMQSLERRGDVMASARASGQALQPYLEDLWRTYYQVLLKGGIASLSPLIVAQEDLLHPDTAAIEVARLANHIGADKLACLEALDWIDPRLDHREGSQIQLQPSTTALHKGLQSMATRQREIFLSTSPAIPKWTEKSRQAPIPPLPAALAPYSILVVSPLGYPHSQAFEEVALSLHHGFRALGIRAPIVRDINKVRGIPIVLGANLLSLMPDIRVPENAIIYNLEQIEDGSAWTQSPYLQLLRKQRVWDYSELNRSELSKAGIEVEAICGIGHVPELERIDAVPEKDIDVLFYGSLNKRRMDILGSIANRGLKVRIATNLYGAERDGFIARAKVLLNIHFYEAKVFEIVRVSYLLANGCAVVSETGTSSTEEAELQDALVFAPYEELAEACELLVADSDRRAKLGAEAQRLFRTRSQADILKDIL